LNVISSIENYFTSSAGYGPTQTIFGLNFSPTPQSPSFLMYILMRLSSDSFVGAQTRIFAGTLSSNFSSTFLRTIGAIFSNFASLSNEGIGS